MSQMTTLKNTYVFKLKNGRTAVIMAKDEKSARTSLVRTRGDYRATYSEAYGATLEETKEAAPVTDAQNTLYTMLRTETEILRVEYIARCKQWAADRFDAAKKIVDIPYEQYTNTAGNCIEKVYAGRPTKVLTKEARERREKAFDVVRKGRENFIAASEKMAELHYNDSLSKLVRRIGAKGLNQDSLEVKGGRVGVNIEVRISDGINSVRAWTIIASGEIQRPHYRYLVK